MILGNEQECESIGGNVNMQAVSNAKCWK